MQTLIVIFIIILILGALAGGKSFGEVIQGGCGCLVIVFILLIVASVIVFNT